MTDQSIEDASRREFERWYQSTYSKPVEFKRWHINPDCYANVEMQSMWEAWQASRQSSQSEPVATADYIAYLYRDGNKLKVLETWPPDNDAFPVFTTNIRFIDVARLVLDDNVDLILEHGGVKLWEALITEVNKNYAERNHEQ
jgi:hypothetical protein